MSTDLKNYDLIYVNLNGLINIVKKDVWEKNNSVNLTGGNIIKLGNYFLFLICTTLKF